MVRFIELSLLFHKSLRIPSLSFLFLPSLSLWLFNFSFVFGFDFFCLLDYRFFPFQQCFSLSQRPHDLNELSEWFMGPRLLRISHSICCVYISPSRDDTTRPIFPLNCFTLNSSLFMIWLISLRENFSSRIPRQNRLFMVFIIDEWRNFHLLCSTAVSAFVNEARDVNRQTDLGWRFFLKNFFAK